jgi:sulfite oxidase
MTGNVNENATVDRRTFIQGATAAVAGAMLAPALASSAAPAPSAEMLIAGKDPRLMIHTPKPATLETPAELLAGAGVTPTPLLFVRNNQEPPEAVTMKPLPLTGWKIDLAGLVDRPQVIDAAVLAEAEQVEREMVLQCSGNGRSLFSKSAPAKGTQWGRGGMGNVRFAGVPLSAVLARHGIRIKPQARYLTAEGADEPAPGEQDFEHSIPVDEALKKSLLALRLGDDLLPAIHGGPVRLLTPGYYGTMHVKWITRLRFTDKESNQTSQIPHYRTPRVPIQPGEPFTPTYENSEPNWRMKIKCVVLSPQPSDTLLSGEVPVVGVAFNDGEAKIESVLVSTDQGLTWQRAQLDVPESPYAWYRWTTTVQVSPTTKQIWARAIDALGRTQPLDGAVHWNPSGYTWNGVERIDVKVQA